MAAIAPKNILLVEGNTEKRLVPYLMEQRGVVWELQPKQYAVDIKVAGGLVTAPDLIKFHLQERALSTFGVVFDADGMQGAEQNRWVAMRNQCQLIGANLPEVAPFDGYLTSLPNGIRFGVWMMPDNRPPGMLETFLLRLLKAEENANSLFQHAKESVDKAKELKAGFKSVHRDKALIHTWLAWQNEPGAQLHEAIKFKILDAASPHADLFVKWFRDLFRV